VRVSEERPVLVDRFLEDAFECDVDAISDGTRGVIGGIMQHIEDAGIHSGDSACVLPPYLVNEADMQVMREQTVALAKALGVVGVMNVQYAIRHGVVYVLEVNPRASRTIPFVSKAIGAPLASYAARVMVGETLDEIGFTEEIIPPYVSVKEAVFPFNKFPGTDPVLGPEMRSTGECMGIADSFGAAFAKAQLAASNGLPLQGVVLITVTDSDKPTVTPIARRFHEMGFEIMATAGTAQYLRARGIPAKRVFKVHEGRPNCLDMIVNRDAQLLINTPMGKHAQLDDYLLRQAAIVHRVSYTTTMSAASAASDAILSLRSRGPRVKSLQEWQADIAAVTT
jgi:carbamoyl-phosphate synthase large subunit